MAAYSSRGMVDQVYVMSRSVDIHEVMLVRMFRCVAIPDKDAMNADSGMCDCTY